MQRTRFGDMACSIARTMDVIGEPWSFLVLRDVYVGMTRFDQIQRGLGISRKVLAERLAWLVERGVLERRAYSEHPPRYDYTLTEKGWDLCDLLLAITAWGDRWTTTEAGPPVYHRHRACGQVTHVELRCDGCGEPMRATDVDIEPGPGAVLPEPEPAPGAAVDDLAPGAVVGDQGPGAAIGDPGSGAVIGPG